MNLWVFDLDGTLVTSNIDYARAVFRWGLMFLDEMGHRAPHHDDFARDFIELLREIDKERFKTMRADRMRFPGSVALAYRALCQHLGMEVNPEIERKSFEVGMTALSEENYRGRGMITGAEEALRFLQEQGEILYCVTAGDPEVQWMKWRGYNLARFFPTEEKFRVVWWEKDEELQRLRRLYPDIPALTVGDSIGSDLLPAHRAGMTPVYVPNPGTWDHGQLVAEFPPGTKKLGKMEEFLPFYGKLFKTN